MSSSVTPCPFNLTRYTPTTARPLASSQRARHNAAYIECHRANLGRVRHFNCGVRCDDPLVIFTSTVSSTPTTCARGGGDVVRTMTTEDVPRIPVISTVT